MFRLTILSFGLATLIGLVSGCKPASGVDDSTFQKVVIESEKPVLVDCWAPWCGPCKTLAPTIDELADEFAGKVDVVKLNVDVGTQTARKYQISAIPTVLIFHKGQVISRRVGVQPKGNYAADLEKALDEGTPSP